MNNVLVRVGTLNNFNFTSTEVNHLNLLSKIYPNKIFFVWSNVKSYNKMYKKNKKEIDNLFKNSNIKLGLTVTPNLEFIKPVTSKNIDNIIYKFVLNNKTNYTRNKVIEYAKKHDLNVLLIPLRFKKTENFNKYVSDTDKYVYIKPYIKLSKHAFVEFAYYTKQMYNKVYTCDLLHLGCTSCYNCYRINNISVVRNFESINLSTSGKCPYNCIECYAKHCLDRTQGKIRYDIFTINTKMKGNQHVKSK